MKKKFLTMHYYLVMAAMLLLAACKKGDTGPAGQAGPAGTANVIYSPWLIVDYNAITGPGGDTIRFVATIPAVNLVDSIISKGEIKVYLNRQIPSNPDVVPLPYFDPIYFDPAVVINPDYSPGLITLSSNYNMGTFDEGAAKRYQYRYILIPGGATAGRPAPGAKSIDWNNYREVQAYLGLKD